MIFIDKYINICYICISYLFMIYEAKRRARKQEAAHLDIIPGVAVFFYFADWRCRTWRKYRNRSRQ